MDDKTKLVIVDQSMKELKPFLFQQSVGFFIPRDDGGVTLASGTLVSIGERVFIATASHAVPDTSENENYTFISKQYGSEIPQSPILNKGKNPDDDPDVGYLELGSNRAAEYLRKTACPLERLAIKGIGRPLRHAMLVGNPGEYVKNKEPIEVGTTGLDPTMIGYLTGPLMESEWPDVPDSDPTKHICLEYPSAPAQELESGKSRNLPHPGGMSGGGLWDCGFEDGVLWTKESAKLIGIQSGWYEDLRYVLAVQIIHWLRLIYNDYQELRQIMEGHFPELSTNSDN